MSLLRSIETGREAKPPRLMIYGDEGVGKSSCSATALNPIFIQIEDGLGEIDCAKFPLVKSFAEVQNALIALRDVSTIFRPQSLILLTGWNGWFGIRYATSLVSGTLKRLTAFMDAATAIP